MNKTLHAALHLLTLREHGEQELIEKLVTKGHLLNDAQEAVTKCKNQGLQSDSRFAENVCKVRIRQGYGPMRIRQELRSKHIAPEIVEEILQNESDNWFEYALAVWEKKDKSFAKQDPKALQKKQRFLLYRGFPSEIVAKIGRKLYEEF